MALNKWDGNKPLKEQISGFNQNLDTVDNFMSGGGWKNLTLEDNFTYYDGNTVPMYRETSDAIQFKGRVRVIDADLIEYGFRIATIDATIVGVKEITLAGQNAAMNAWVAPDGSINVRAINGSTKPSIIGFDGVTIYK